MALIELHPLYCSFDLNTSYIFYFVRVRPLQHIANNYDRENICKNICNSICKGIFQNATLIICYIRFAFQDESRLIMGMTYCNICFAAAINIVTERHVPWMECVSLVIVLYSVARNLLDFWQSVNWSIRRCHILKFVPNVRIMAKKDFFLKSIIRMVGGKKKLASNKTVYITFNFWQG